MKGLTNIIEKQSYTEVRDVVVAIECNRCHKRITLENGMPVDGISDISVIARYPSKFDMTKYVGHVCDECIEKMVKENGLLALEEMLGCRCPQDTFINHATCDCNTNGDCRTPK